MEPTFIIYHNFDSVISPSVALRKTQEYLLNLKDSKQRHIQIHVKDLKWSFV